MKCDLSVIVITKNEEANIKACLESVCWADEIVVVDSGSVDATCDICRSFPKVRFFELPWQGYGPQKNLALDRARGKWVLSIDADEVVTPELAAEIRSAISCRMEFDGYLVHRRNYYRGKLITHSGWWPDEILRFFRRESGRFSERVVHETLEVKGRVGKLKGCVEHRSFHSAGDFLEKAQSYSTLGAEQLRISGKNASSVKAMSRSLFSFFKCYILQRGFLDGRAGLLIAYANAVGVFFRYMKRLELDDDFGGSK